MTINEKRCRKCDEVKPIVEFYPHANYADGYDNRCRTCINRSPKSEELKLEVRIRSRAHNRATAALKTLYEDQYQQLYSEFLVSVRAEAETLGPTARLKTGKARAGESVADRIRELCADCGTSHEQGHTCPHCGATPEHGPTKAIVPRRRTPAPAPVDETTARRQRIAELNAQVMRDRDQRRTAS